MNVAALCSLRTCISICLNIETEILNNNIIIFCFNIARYEQTRHTFYTCIYISILATIKAHYLLLFIMIVIIYRQPIILHNNSKIMTMNTIHYFSYTWFIIFNVSTYTVQNPLRNYIHKMRVMANMSIIMSFKTLRIV